MSFLHDPIHRRAALERLSLLVGGTLAAPLASGLLAGCRTPAPGETFAYQVLGADQQRLLATLVDRIIPETDTPGASAAGVPQFIDKMLAAWYPEQEREAFLAGLADFDAQTRAEQGTAFTDLDADEQASVVATLDAAAFAPAPEPGTAATDDEVVGAGQEGTYEARAEVDREVAGVQDEGGRGDEGGDSNVQAPAPRSRVAADASRFYVQLKQLTLAGYYTSEVGATQELRYDALMGRYDADVPFSEIGRAWA